MASNAIALTNTQQREPSRQQHPKSKKHPSSKSPYAPNPSTTNNTPTTELTARADRTSGARSTLRAFTKHPSHARTTCEAARRCPKPPRGANAPHSGAPKQPTPHDTPARTVTNTHSDSTGGVPPRIPTPAGPLRARNLDKRLCVESSAAARRLVPSSATPKALTQHAVTRDHQ